MDDLEIDDSYIKVGRGPSIYNHAGNARFRFMVSKHLVSYKNSSRPQKTSLVNSVHDEMLENGMKFIKMVDGMWKQLDDENKVRRTKVAHRFRDAIEAERSKQVIRPLVTPIVAPAPPLPHTGIEIGRPRCSAQHAADTLIAKSVPHIGAPPPKRTAQGVERVYSQPTGDGGGKKKDSRILDIPRLCSRAHKEDYPKECGANCESTNTNQRPPHTLAAGNGAGCSVPYSISELVMDADNTTDAAASTVLLDSNVRLRSGPHRQIMHEVHGAPRRRNEHLRAPGMGASTGVRPDLSGIFDEVNELFGLQPIMQTTDSNINDFIS